jgi:hypothetical protein
MPPSTGQKGIKPDDAVTPPQDMSMALKKLGSGSGGRLNVQDNPCQLDYVGKEDDSDDNSVSSSVTVNNAFHIVTPPSTNTPVGSLQNNRALDETPENKRSATRKAPDDCHVPLVQWSELQKLVKDRMACAKCGMLVTKFNRQTIGIATELDFSCTTCNTEGTANAIQSNYPLENRETDDFLHRERQADSYELNWGLILATQQLGESQVGGSIIAFFLSRFD